LKDDFETAGEIDNRGDELKKLKLERIYDMHKLSAKERKKDKMNRASKAMSSNAHLSSHSGSLHLKQRLKT
jgi:hypothetical protein